FAWSGAKIRPKFETIASKHASSYGRYSASPTSNTISTPSSSARRRAFSIIGAAMSTAVTFAPALAARTATSPVPLARSRTRSPSWIPTRATSSSCTGAKRAASRSYVPRLQTSLTSAAYFAHGRPLQRGRGAPAERERTARAAAAAAVARRLRRPGARHRAGPGAPPRDRAGPRPVDDPVRPAGLGQDHACTDRRADDRGGVRGAVRGV